MPSSSAIQVCIANPWFYPRIVGPGERFRRYSQGLEARGIRLRVITVLRDGLMQRDTVDGIQVERVRVSGESRFQERTATYRALPRLLTDSRPDVFQLFSTGLPEALLTGVLRTFGIPSVLVVTMVPAGRTSSRHRLISTVHRRLVHSPFRAIVTSSTSMTDEVVSWGISKNRVHTIPNGVDTERFKPCDLPSERVALRDKLGFDRNGLVFMSVGGMFPRKCPHLLLEAWHRVSAAIPEATLVLVGPWPSEEKYTVYVKSLRDLIRSSPVPSRVIVTGPVANVHEFLRAADVFVFPSEREGMPNVVPEAMATGLPCVLTPFKGLPAEFGWPAVHYELVDRNVAALEQIMLVLAQDASRRSDLGERARKWVLDELDVGVSLDRYADLYREVSCGR